MAHEAISNVVDSGSDASVTDGVRFAIFAAVNRNAIHLLESIKYATSTPTLKSDENSIGYHLSITGSHAEKDYEWRIGAGSTSNSSQKKKYPDILLCPPKKTPGSLRAREFIEDTHASIFFHQESAALMFKICGKRTVIYEKGNANGTDLTLRAEGTKMCVLRKARNYLRFGPYRFLLKFAVDDQDQNDFNAQLDNKLGYCYWQRPPSRVFSLTPASTELSGNIWVHSSLLESAISVGVDIRTGQPVSMQRVELQGTKRNSLLDWFALVRQYKDLRQGIVGVIDVWTEINDDYQCFCFSAPLPINNFHHMYEMRICSSARLLYFYQTLLGLSELHRREITHGNIRPEVLYLFPDLTCMSQSNGDSQPKRAAIFPLFQSLEQSRERDPDLCTAPEALDDHGEIDRAKADIWALAASWLMTYLKSPSHTKRRTQPHKKIEEILNKLGQSESSPSLPFMDLLRKMLALDPQKRPNATEALGHIVWEPILKQKTEIENRKKRKRDGELQQSDRRVKFKRLSLDMDDKR